MNHQLPIPENESDRLKALEKYNILDTLSEVEFDRLTKLAAIICGVPIALVSLIDKNRQWFKSVIGLDVPQTSRDISFCQYAIVGNSLFEIEDATLDERFVNNPLVTDQPNIRFYAGYPLMDPNGYVLGTLCVIDREARRLSSDQQSALTLLAEEVVSQIVSRQKNIEKDKLEKLFNLSIDMICVAGTDGYFKKTNPAFQTTLGWSLDELKEKPFFDYIHPDDVNATANEIEKLSKGFKTIGFENRFITKEGNYLSIAWVANPDEQTGEIFAIGRNISDKKLWEQKLLSSEAKYRGFFENSRSLVCTHDLKGNILSINHASALSIGYSVEEACTLNFLDIVPPHTKHLVQLFLNELEQTGMSKGLMKINHKSGPTKTWMYDSVVIQQPDGSKIVLGTAVDMTDRILLEKELKESNDRFFKIFDKNPVIMVISNMATTKIEYVNETFLEVFGYTKEEVIGKTSIELNIISAEEREKIIAVLKKEGYVRSVEGIMRKKNGEKIWILNSIEIIDINGNPFIVSSINNIDERKKMEEEISRLAEFQNIILNGTDYSIISTSELGIIKSFNKGAEKMLGYKAEELIGVTPAILHEGSEVVERSKVLTDELKINVEPGVDVFLIKPRITNLNDVNEWTYIRKDGSKLPVELAVSTLRGSKNEIVGYLGIAKDISESKMAKEAILNAIEKAEQAVVAKNSFLANMSHEIRTPMNAIIGFTDLLYQSELDENQMECVSSIKLAGGNLLSIINDILDFSKIESGKITIENVPFSLKDTLKNIYNLLTPKAKEKNLEYEFFLDASLPDVVVGDSVRLNQIMVNLIGNAIKFTEKGSITVSAKKIEENNTFYKIKFVVRDTGIGISEDKINLVFDRFAQANAETTRKFGGTGLGLSIAKNLIELQGGEIKLKSELGRGSEFSFEIQYKKADEKLVNKGKESTLTPQKTLGNIRILLCEDNLLNQSLAKKVFIKFGFNFEIADNGKIGVEKLKTEKFDLVLMDLQMPEMDGYQATLAIRNDLKLQIPIIAMTAHSLIGEKEKCMEIGMNDYVGKPFTQEDLYSKICSNLLNTSNPSGDSSTNSPVQLNTNLDSINLNFLKEFSEGNKQFEKEMIELFLDQVPKDIADLDKAFKESDTLVIKQIAHKLKPSMSLLGLLTIAEDFNFIEKNVLAPEMFQSLVEKFDFVKITLNKSYLILQQQLKNEY